MAKSSEDEVRRRAQEQLEQQQKAREIAHQQALKRAREQLAREQAAREADERQRQREQDRNKGK